jgi:hypothetical protein
MVTHVVFVEKEAKLTAQNRGVRYGKRKAEYSSGAINFSSRQGKNKTTCKKWPITLIMF